MPVDEALARLLEAAVPAAEQETVSLHMARNRVLAADVVATVDVPPADNSAMDGYALRVADLTSGMALPVSQRIPAGSLPAPLEPGTVARIFTGAPLPPGADAVVMQEDCRQEGGRVSVAPAEVARLRPGANVRPRGQDLCAGSVVLAAGTRLGATQLGVVAAAGHAQLPVWRRPVVAVLSTGDELQEPGTPPQPGHIYNSNRYLLLAWLEQLGCRTVDIGRVADDRAGTVRALQAAAASADLVLTTGGASVGEEDHLVAALSECGQLDLWKVAIKPGKPLLSGRVGTARGQVPLLGLPGNPASVAVTFLVLALPFLRRLQGDRASPPAGYRLPAAFTLAHPGKRTEYFRARVVDGRVERYPNQSSGVLMSMAWAGGFAVVPAGQTVEAGAPVRYLSLAELLDPPP